ncbi:MAG: NAD-dependent malic enzyme [Anaerolineae bacterium]
MELLHDPALNKGTAFSDAERDALGLRGLLPPHVGSPSDQQARVLANMRAKANDLERYIYLIGLQDRNETLFYRVLVDHVEEMLPIVYTPTVGEACQHFGKIFRRARGLFISAEDGGRVAQVVANWPSDDVQVIVVTDGERILGLGDLGANGMGIPIGKLALYTTGAGVSPAACLPVTLDVGTNNSQLLESPFYLGLRRPRLKGKAYDDLVDEFVGAALERYPDALIQFEDFANTNADRLLAKYRDRICTFNDDIQGTAGVVLAGLYSAMRITGGQLRDQTVLFLGTGSAGIGVGRLLASAMGMEGLTVDEARARLWYMDSRGLVVKGRDHLTPQKEAVAHDHEAVDELLAAVKSLRPSVLIGVSGVGGQFTPEVIRAMADINDRPVIFALSNPTSQSECTAEEAYAHSEGRAIFASGSPFPTVTIAGKTFVPGQGNNVYVFPGVGLGVIASRAGRVTDAMFMAAAKTLAAEATAEHLAAGCIYPPLDRLRELSFLTARAVAQEAYTSGLARAPRPADLDSLIRSHVYEPVYQSFV